MRTTTVTTDDGFPLAVQESGLADGPVLLLLPGQANNHGWWTCLRSAFDERFRVITFDWRGTGASRGPVGDWSTGLFAADAAQVLAALGVATASVYGASMGGRVAQVLAGSRPAVVDRLVLACTSPGGPHAHERSLDVRRSLVDPDPDQRLAALHRLFYTGAWPHRPSDSHLLGDPSMSREESRAHLRVSARHDAWDSLPLICAPALVLHGAADLMSPVENAALLGSRISSSAVHVHPTGRHGFFEEFAGEITPLVLSFL